MATTTKGLYARGIGNNTERTYGLYARGLAVGPDSEESSAPLGRGIGIGRLHRGWRIIIPFIWLVVS